VWLRRRNYDKALALPDGHRRWTATSALSYWAWAGRAARNDDCPGALPNFQKAVELDHKFPDAQLALGDCLTTAQVRRAVVR